MKTIAQQINWDFEANGRLEINDKKGSLIYYEFPNGHWAKMEWDSQDLVVHYEDSEGNVEDYRSKPSEDKVVEIEAIEINGVKYKLTKL